MQLTKNKTTYLEVSVCNNPISEKDPSDAPTKAIYENGVESNQQCIIEECSNLAIQILQ